jgi:3-hydroxyisobutyrate dehydrogenase-like beta-hydroxyacid dehydrogenase
MTHVAFLGTGLLGSGFVHGLLARGTSVTAWNRTAAKAEALASAGARVAASAADAVRGARRVHLCLAADAAVDEVLAAIDGAVGPGVVIVDHSTTSPDGAAERGARLAARGQRFLHAPVFMSPSAARSAGGMMLVVGPKDTLSAVEDELRTMTGDLWYLGDDLRRAAALKLLGNAMLIALAAGLADVFTVGAGLGVASGDAHALLARLKPGGSIDIRGKRMATGDFAATFELAMARKDVGLMIDAAGARRLAVLPAIAARADELIERGLGDKDLGVLAVDAVTAKG